MSRGRSLGLALIERPRQVEASLWRRLRFENQPRCRELLFNRYLRLARAIAGQEFRRRPAYGMERSDFEQLAYGGLLESIDRYDPMRGAHFIAYAKHRIRGAISDGLSKSSEAGAHYTYRSRVEAERLKSVAPAGFATRDGLEDLREVATFLAIGFLVDDANLLAEDAAVLSEPDAFETLAWRETQVAVLQAIERLPLIEKTILQQHYLKGVSFTHVAALLGVSKGRVSQIHRAALKRVRSSIRAMEQV